MGLVVGSGLALGGDGRSRLGSRSGNFSLLTGTNQIGFALLLAAVAPAGFQGTTILAPGTTSAFSTNG